MGPKSARKAGGSDDSSSFVVYHFDAVNFYFRLLEIRNFAPIKQDWSSVYHFTKLGARRPGLQPGGPEWPGQARPGQMRQPGTRIMRFETAYSLSCSCIIGRAGARPTTM